MTDLHTARDHLAQLIAFDTTSRDSNLALIDWVEEQLAPLGVTFTRIPNETGDKANLWVRIGPDAPGGIVLSGHTDVVPVDGQPWDTDPWTLTENEGRLYGRGTCDMKAFVALCTAFAPAFAANALSKPVHFAFSYDEEVGCTGVTPMIDKMVAAGAAPSAVWVGEPTLWKAVSGHKGIMGYEVEVLGREAHSSLPHHGVSAVGEAIDLMTILRRIAADAEASPPEGSTFDPPHATLTIGEVSGGTAINIIARQCRFAFDLRRPAGVDADALLAPFMEAVAAADARIKATVPEGGVTVRQLCNAPPLMPDRDSTAETLVRRLTGDNSDRVVSYAAEAGQFQEAGFPTVICGPGSIEQAHQPNEYLAISELARGVEIFGKLVREIG